MANINENILEKTTLAWFEDIGYVAAFGPDLAFDGARPERSKKANYGDVILGERLRTALHNINPDIPPSAIDDAVRKIVVTETLSSTENNRRFHRMLTDGVDVEIISEDEYGGVWHVEPACALHADGETGL